MDILLTIIKYLEYAFTIGSAKNALVKGYKFIDRISDGLDFEDVEELSREFFKGTISYGSTVKLEGLISEYGHTYRPHTYAPTIPLIAKAHRIGTYGSTSTSFGVFQPPVEILPHVDYNGKLSRLVFVYPTNFMGFEYEQGLLTVEESIAQRKPYIHVPESAKPIPLILSGIMQVTTGARAKIKARVIELPLEQLVTLASHVRDFSLPIYGRSLDLTSMSRKSLCLLVGEDDTYIKEDSNYILPSKLPAYFFVEGHINTEGINLDPADFIGRCVPGVVGPIRIMNYTAAGDIKPFLTGGNVRVILRDPSIVSFYVEIDLCDGGLYRQRIEELRDVVRKFDREVQNLSQALIGRRRHFQVDFISDARLKTELTLPRVLQSDEVNQIINNNPSVRDIRDWMLLPPHFHIGSNK